jgi:hypothetical protein
MKIAFLLLCSFLCVQSRAQLLPPWTNLPQNKTAENKNMEEVPVFLVVDTLRQKSTDESVRKTINFFYNSRVDLIGYGYKDAAGNPFGVWKYYIVANDKYQLACEGNYRQLTPGNLVVEPDIIKQFPVSNTLSVKEDFINSLSDKLFFTGEWRFYEDGRLEKIIQLDDKVRLPYQLSVRLVSQSVASQEEQLSNQLSILMPVNRLTGNMTVYVHFSNQGFIESIFSENIRWKFDAKGKPLIDPLPEQ